MRAFFFTWDRINPPSQTEVINAYEIVKNPQERLENLNEFQPQSKTSHSILATVEFLGLKAIFNLIHR